MPRITVASVFVDNQDKALSFYTEVLGFVKKTEIPLGEARWLTVVSSDDPDGTELLLEPDGHPAVARSSWRWWKTASPSPPSVWTTSTPSTNGFVPWGSGSPRSRWTLARSSRPCSTTPAAT